MNESSVSIVMCMALNREKMSGIRKIVWLAVVLIGLSAVSCARRADESRTLAVSILPQKFLLERIVGDRYPVTCMLEKGGSPETYDPAMSQMMELERCAAYFKIGNMGFEEKIGRRLEELGGIRIVDSSAGVGLIKGHRHSGDEDDESIDPHVWMSVANMRRIARNMTEAVSELDEANRTFYEENLRKLESELTALDDSIAARLAPVRGRAFVVWHPSLSYFARDYGLEQVSVEYDGKEAPIRFVEDRIAYAGDRGAAVFLLQAGADSRQAAAVAGQLGIRRAEINPLAYDWIAEMKHIADELSR